MITCAIHVSPDSQAKFLAALERAAARMAKFTRRMKKVDATVAFNVKRRSHWTRTPEAGRA